MANKTIDELDALNQESTTDSSLSAGLQKNQRIAEIQQEWFDRTPQENLDLLNAESSQTGVYGFEYLTDASGAANIPGMTAVSYEVPNDPNGGVYVGYESYEQTYAKAKQEYQSIVSGGGTPTEEQEEAYQLATEQYSVQKSEYETYLSENPAAPDYLNSENPVTSYVEFEGPRAQAEASANSELNQAASDVSMDDVSTAMENGTTGAFHVQSAAVSGRYAEQYAAVNGEVEESQEYVARISDTIDKDTIAGMQNYTSTNGATIPEITAEEGTDEYGQQIVEMLKAIDSDLEASDSSYTSSFPESMKYYADGENPEAIPGMTLVVGKIDGAPGYYAGYESYDATYQNALTTLDAESAAIEELQNDPTASASELAERQEAVDAGYVSANATYDMQKTQYEDYVSANPGNDFLASDSSVESYDEFNSSSDVSKTGKNFYAKVKDFLNNGITSLSAWVKKIGAKLTGKSTDEFYDEEEATVMNADYWAKRAALNPEDTVAQEHAVTSNMEYQEQLASHDVDGTATTGNRYRDILNNSGVTAEPDYEVQNPMSTGKQIQQYGSTGNQLLDELSAGSTDSVDSMVVNMPDADASQQVASAAQRTVQNSAKSSGKSVPSSQRTVDSSVVQQGAEALEARLAAASGDTLEAGMSYGS